MAYIMQCLLANLSVVFLLFLSLRFLSLQIRMSQRKNNKLQRKMEKELQKAVEIGRKRKEEETKKEEEYLTESTVDKLVKERARERMQMVKVMPLTVFQDPPAKNLECLIELTDQEHRDLLWDLGLLF